MDEQERGQLNRQQIEAHLKSAVTGLTPNVLDKIDLSAPQEIFSQNGGVLRRLNRIRAAVAFAACLCMVLTVGGLSAYKNGKVESVVGIDVNPSIELSVNRRDKVLRAQALNEDATVIMDEMKLEGVDLNVAVNAVIGSMVKHGYLDDLDNAILVTVSNDSISKAAALRSEVVEDIQTSLEENQVKAVVYDQQAVEVDEVKELAEKYGISYGKAYFLDELIAQNPALTLEDMEKLAPLTMEEIAREITEGAYALGRQADKTEETSMVASRSTAAAATAPETTAPSSEETTTGNVPPSEDIQTQPAAMAPPVTEPPEETVAESKIKIDDADYDDGIVTVKFAVQVKWKNATVSVRDEEGNSYAAMLGDIGSDFCEILADGLEGGKKYTFVLGGISLKIGKATTVKGTFETPVIGDGGKLPIIPDEEREPSTETEATTAGTVSPSEPSTEQTLPTETQPTEQQSTEQQPTETPSPDTGAEPEQMPEESLSSATEPSSEEAPVETVGEVETSVQ